MDVVVERGSVTKIQIYVVPKNRRLPPLPREAFLNPDAMEDLPVGYTREGFWLVDTGVERSLLGLGGVFIFETFFKTLARIGIDEQGQSVAPNAVSGGGGGCAGVDTADR